MRLLGTAKIVGLALLGLLVAAAIGVLTNAVASDSIGLSVKPSATAPGLAPAAASGPTDGDHSAQSDDHDADDSGSHDD